MACAAGDEKNIENFGTLYSRLSDKMATFFASNETDDTLPTVLFLGNAGAGKSTLVQLLAGNDDKMISKEASDISGHYIIVDGNNKIGSKTVESMTLFAELIFDNTNNIFMCDSPGFCDTRSPTHEIVAANSMKRIIEKTKSVKLVLVVTHDSLRKGMFRSDFDNLLKQIHDFVKDVDKYRNSFFLVATKVDGSHFYANRTLFKVSDETIVKGISEFLKESKLSYTKKYKTDRNNAFLTSALKIIDALLTNTNGVFSRINILRKPNAPGRVSEIDILQRQKQSLRNMLLVPNNFIRNSENDFGNAISDFARLFLLDLFENLNMYILRKTKDIAAFMSQHYLRKLEENYGIDDKISDIQNIKTSLENLYADLLKCRNPKEYVAIMKSFILNENLPICTDFLNNISMYDSHLGNIIHLSGSEIYSVGSWSDNLFETVKEVEDELNFHLLIKNVFDLLKGYTFQKNKKIYNVADLDSWGRPGMEQGLKINKNNFVMFLNKIEKKGFSEVKLNAARLTRLNYIISDTIGSSTTADCKENELNIVGNFILMSDVSKHANSKLNWESIVVAASHTIYIDIDVDEEIMAGKNLILMAPLWVVDGKRRIKLDGGVPERKQSKAGFGEIGLDGKEGNPGGSFFGVGMFFENGGELTVSASGGSGQDGQDGGDGVNGIQGFENWQEIHENGRHLIKGKPGTPGGDAGAGGQGGRGGRQGTVNLHFLGKENPKINIISVDGPEGAKGSDGRPGRGGYNGSNQEIVTEEKKKLLGIEISDQVEDLLIKWSMLLTNSWLVGTAAVFVVKTKCKYTLIFPSNPEFNPDGAVRYFPRKTNHWAPTLNPFPINFYRNYNKLSSDIFQSDYFNIVTSYLSQNFQKEMKQRLGC